MVDQKSVLIAFALSMVVLFGYQFLIVEPKMQAERERRELIEQQRADQEAAGLAGTPTDAPRPTGDAPTVPELAAGPGLAAPTPARGAKRIAIETPRLRGSLSTQGARLDDLLLADYFDELGEDADNIVLLQHTGTEQAYFADFGWAARGQGTALPTPDTVWTASADTLTPDRPLVLTWDNGAGLVFTRTIAVDEDFLFTITQSVENRTDGAVALAPYGLIARQSTPETSGFFILHEGPLGVFDETLKEVDYDELREDSTVNVTSTGGWIGITDKYWLTALIPDQDIAFAGRFQHLLRNGGDRYQVDYLDAEQIVEPGARLAVTSHLFAGAKEVDLIDGYGAALDIDRFDLAIDWGWFFFLTKPIFYALDYLNKLTGNFGVAILLLTVGVKLIFFPLANKSYESMTRMKKMQPKMKALQERFKDDKVRMQQELMELYKKEKINPLAGCLPILIQIPVFFALYKTLFVTIEMRHQPFFGWIEGLSAADPWTPLNLFGLIPWDPPSFIAVGIWPILMGVSMYLQQKLNPQPTDPMQQKIFAFLPIIFTFILAPFPVGLVIYWTWNNLLSMLQQWVIMRRMGVKVSDG